MIMALSSSRRSLAVPARRRFGLALHLALIGLVLLGSAFAPRPGRAVLLVPFAQRTNALAGQPALSGSGWAVAGRGRVAGSWLVHATGQVPVLALLRQGILPLAVPEALCGGGQ